MRVRALVLVVVLTVAAGLSGCSLGRTRDRDGWRHGGGTMAMSMASSEAAWLAEMIPHHEEAVDAARELARSARPEMRTLGESIVRSQTAQIEQMRGWLAAWYPTQREDPAYRPMMRDLSGLTGDALDRAFLEDMVRHHMMAVMMSQHLLRARTATHPEVADLAGRIIDEQRAEIRQMNRWLASWFGQPGPGRHMS